jgi:hypothetical protein
MYGPVTADGDEVQLWRVHSKDAKAQLAARESGHGKRRKSNDARSVAPGTFEQEISPRLSLRRGSRSRFGQTQPVARRPQC